MGPCYKEPRMIRSVLCVALLFGPVTVRADPFLGQWKVDLVGAPAGLTMEFFGDSTFATEGAKPAPYTIDENARSIDLGVVAGSRLAATYSFDSARGAFYLFPARDVVVKLLGSGPDNSKATAFTRDYFAKFMAAMIDVLQGIPIAVGERVR
jgi:hypothetical protein